MVFYFTGTGNSLYVAKQLDQELYSIPQVIHEKELIFRSDAIGIVCPIYGHEVPPMVKDFLERATFQTEYLYLVLTYGKLHGGAAELTEAMLETFGKKADYINTILMVDNFLPAFDMEEQVRMAPEKKIEEQIAAVKADIEARKRWHQPATEADRQLHRDYLAGVAQVPQEVFSHFYTVTEGCIGCGICTRVCPAGCIHLEDQRAVHDLKNCQMCMACIHHCPQNAIRMALPEKNPSARFHNENIRLTEIVEANEQR